MNDSHIKEIVQRYAPAELLQEEDACDYFVSVLLDEMQTTLTSGARRDTIRELASQLLGQNAEENSTAVDCLVRDLMNLQLQEQEEAKAKPADHEPAGKEGQETCGTIKHSSISPPLSPGRTEEDDTTDDATTSDDSSPSKPSKAEERRKRREAKRLVRSNKSKQALSTKTPAALNDFVDDDISAWKDRVAEGKAWGGRGHGGRGVRGDVNTATNIHLPNVTLQFSGNELLQNSTIQINGGHIYGLLGRNGCGKSTLCRRLAEHAIPGIPHDLRILLVKQQAEEGEETAIEALLGADHERLELLQEQAELEAQMEATQDLQLLVERLADIADALDAMDADGAEERAKRILKGLQFSEEMIYSPTKNLSGGWRMRLALAEALFVPSDLLILDEPTNHLDLSALSWLSNYLKNSNRTIIAISHDRVFLDICTDIITFEHKKLKYHPGNYSAYELHQKEKAAHQAQILDASERQRAKAMAFVQKQEAFANKKNADPKKQRQAKMIRDKKMDRIGNYREDGKRYKNFSLAKLSEDSIRLAEKVQIEEDDPIIRMKFPDPTWASGMTPECTLLKMESVEFSYSRSDPEPLLTNVTLNVGRGSKVAVVGANGSGKSTLLKLITGEINPSSSSVNFKGDIWRYPSLRIGHVDQYSIEGLEPFGDQTVVEYAEITLMKGKASSTIIQNASGNVRQYLGAFGLGGVHAHRPIASLSGGERMRLCFATILAEQPHLLVLDESTNHLDLETLDALSSALDSYQGSVVIVSHNQSFLSGFCKDLWVVDRKTVEIRYSDTETFDEMFSEYRNEALSGVEERATNRQTKASLLKKATRQRAGMQQGTGLIP